MKSRRGTELTFTTLAVAALVVLVLIVVALTFSRGQVALKNSLSCNEEQGQYQCSSWGDMCSGIGEGWSMHLNGIIGCKGVKVCCVNEQWTDPAGGGSTSPVPVIARPTISVRQGEAQTTYREGQTIVSVPQKPQQFLISGTGPTKDSAGKEIKTWEANVVFQKSNGEKIDENHITFSGGTVDSVAALADKIAKEMNAEGKFSARTDLSFNPAIVGETVVMVISLYPGAGIEEAIKNNPSAVEQYRLYFTIKPALRYIGNTQTWARAKQITAGCEHIECEQIYYEIVDMEGNTPSLCNPEGKDFASARSILQDTQYCVPGKPGTCAGDIMTCFANRDRLNPQASTAFNALKAAINAGLIDPNDAQFAQIAGAFSQQESRSTSTANSCVPDVTGAVGKRIFKADTWSPDSLGGRGTFTLNLPSMQGKGLCVYGKEKGTDKYYSAQAEAQKIMIDLTPPIATVTFQPWTLTLRFSCEDKLGDGDDIGSGCKPLYGTAFISDITSYIATLGRASNKNADAWCPQGGYSSSGRQEVVYTYNDIRVLCLQVEDNAGNKGKAMTTVYNSYSVLAAAIAEAQD